MLRVKACPGTYLIQLSSMRANKVTGEMITHENQSQSQPRLIIFQTYCMYSEYLRLVAQRRT